MLKIHVPATFKLRPMGIPLSNKTCDPTAGDICRGDKVRLTLSRPRTMSYPLKSKVHQFVPSWSQPKFPRFSSHSISTRVYCTTP